MINLDIEEIGKEENLLIRSCKVKINGNTVITPTRTIGTTPTNAFELQEAKSYIGNKFTPFGEVYVKVTLTELSEYIINDDKCQKFCSKISTRLSQLKQAGALPYILLSITDENGNPLNQMLPPKVQKFVFDILWGTPGNSIIVTPLLGIFTSGQDYTRMIDAFHQRQLDSIDRKNQPLMAIVPPSYTLIDPKLIEKYWNSGCRIFGYNCENKKYGAFEYIIESLHTELSKLSKESEEKYIINGINSKYKYGKSKTSRINNLLGTGFGFDTYSPNHVISRFFSNGVPKRYIFNDSDYGFLNVSELENIRNVDKIIDTAVFKPLDLSNLKEMSDSKLVKICKIHDLEKTIKEIENYPNFIQNNKLMKYLEVKEKIQNERIEISSFGQNRSNDEEWFV